MGIFKSCQAWLRPAWNHDRLKTTLLNELGPAGPRMAKLVVDAAKRNSETGRYDVEKHVCINRFRDRYRSDPSRPDREKKLVSSIDASDLMEMTTFHKDVIEPLVRKFVKTRFQFNPGRLTTNGGKIGDERTEDRLVSFRNAFYHYQFACIMATRYQRNDDGTCQDISLSQEHGENDMLCSIPSLYLNGEERLHLWEIVNWVEGHYGRLIDEALKGRPQKDNEELLSRFKDSPPDFITNSFLQAVF